MEQFWEDARRSGLAEGQVRHQVHRDVTENNCPGRGQGLGAD